MSDSKYRKNNGWNGNKKRGKRRKLPKVKKLGKRTSGHSGHWKDNKKKGLCDRFKKLIKVIFSKGFFVNLVLAGLVLFVSGVVAFGFLYVFMGRNLPDPNALQDRTIAQSTKIYDRTGEHLLYEIHGAEKRTLVPIDEIPRHVINALLSAEDDGFYEHHGIDFRGIIRSALKNAFTSSKQGASTLTQQLVKNAILTSERTYTRKIKEIILSLKLESTYTKDEILQLYFNEIPFGSTNYGIEAAAQSYFGKEARDLTVAEGATLIGMIKAPTYYINNPDRLEIRRDYVIASMVEDGFIDQPTADLALNEKTPLNVSASNITAPHFVFYVKQQLEEKYGQRLVEEGGLKVITTLDYDLQVMAQRELDEQVKDRGEGLGFTNDAMVALDPRTGQLLGMVGSHDYFDEENDGAVNVALRPRQPGSSLKPFAYAALFDKGYTPNTVFYDVNTNFPSDGGGYKPHNYGGSEHGPITVRKALQGSLNIPAVKALYIVGVENFLQFIERFGYSTFEDRSRFGLAVVLGGGEVTLLEHTNAYATLANNGVRHDVSSILSVEMSDGESLFEWEPDDGEQVVDENVAKTVTNVLSDNNARAYIFGTGSYLQLGNRPVAAKTGTTNDNRDGWTMGYTPSIAIGIWGGNNDNSKMAYNAGGSNVAAPIWNAVMKQYLDGTEIERFDSPSIPKLGKGVLDGDLESEQRLLVDRITGKLATDETPLRLREERVYATHHSFLYWVNLYDKTGESPKEGSKDPQFANWEKGVAEWVIKQAEDGGTTVLNEEPPTEYDDVHTAANRPVVRVLEPASHETLESRSLQIQARVTARRRIDRVEFYVDGFFLGVDSSSPYRLNANIPSFIAKGQHTIKVVAFDDVENEGSATVVVKVPVAETGSLQIVDPRPGQKIEKVDEKYPVKVELDDPSKYQKIEFFVGTRAGSGGSLIGTILSPRKFSDSYNWVLPDAGEYVVSAVATEIGGHKTVSAGSVIVVVTDPIADSTDGDVVEEES